jgi:hypothetical protein
MTIENAIGNIQLDIANNLSDVPNKPLALSNLGGIGAATTDTLTNKSMDGLLNTFTNLPASAITGIVPVINGGTGNNNRTLTDSSLILSANWGNRLFYNSLGRISLDYNNYILYDAQSTPIPSIMWNTRFLTDSNFVNSLAWNLRRLIDNANALSLDWNARQAYANDGTTLKIDWSDPSSTNFTSIQGIEFAVVPGAAPTVNYITVNGSPTGNSPIFNSVGSDTDVSMTFMTPGAGSYDFTSGTTTMLALNNQAGAVNNFAMSAATTGNLPLLQVGGSDTDVGMGFLTQGVGGYNFSAGNGDLFNILNPGGTVVNTILAQPSATGAPIRMFPSGTDTNIDFRLYGQGTGHLLLGSAQLKFPNADGSTNNVMITDGSGSLSFAPLLTAISTQQVYVSLQGSDSTGDGSANNPWATITHAQNNISPTTTTRYTIWVDAGFYSENISLKANVFIAGAAPVETRLTGNIDINNSSWNVNADNRSGFANIELRGNITFDFTAQTNNLQGKLYLFEVRISNAPLITGLSQFESNQVVFDSCYFFSGVSNTGCIVQAVNCYNSGGTYQNNSSASPSIATDFEIVGGANDGNYSNTWTSNVACTMEIEGVGFSNTTTLATSGASATTTINGGSLPMRANVTNTSSGTTVILGDSSMINAKINFGRAFSAHTLAASTGRRPSTTNDTFINFTGTIVNVIAATASITLQTSPDNSTWTTIQTFVLPLVSVGSAVPFSALIPAGYYYQWISSISAGGTNTISSIQELSL